MPSVDNLLLYNGPSKDGLKNNIVTMNETEDRLSFVMSSRNSLNSNEVTTKIAMESVGGNFNYSYFVSGRMTDRVVPENIFTTISEFIQDPSAHKVYRKAVFNLLRKHTKVDSFKTLSAPEQTISKAMYPILEYIPINSLNTLYSINASEHRENLRSLKAKTVQDMAKRLFGQKRYRKDLVKALANANSVEFLAFMFSLKREIPVDWFISILRNNPTLSYLPTTFNYKDLKEFYDSLSDKQFRKFCKCLMEEDFIPIQSIMDTAYQFKECLDDDHNQIDPITDIKFRSIEELHYMTTKYFENTVKERERRALIEKYGGAIDGNKYYEELSTIDFSGASYELVVPENAYELVQWGSEMSNCIGGYSTSAKSSTTDVYLAMKDRNSDKMVANVLISKKNIVQFYGKRNSKVNKKLAFDFNLRLMLSGFITKGSQLYSNDFRDIEEATNTTDEQELVDDFKKSNSSIDTYIAKRIK